MRSLLLVPVLFVSMSCGGTVPVPVDAGLGVGVRCTADAECASGVCLASEGVCTQTCASDADCAVASGLAALVCGRAACASPEGCMQCVPPCGSPNYTCVAEVSTDCSLADDTYCLDCGCAVATDHCVRNVGCFPPAPVGDACNLDRDCASGSCSTFADVCRVPVGAPCDATNCDACLGLPDGTTHCSRECRTAADCNGDACVGSRALAFYECQPPACAAGTCTVDRAPRAVGEACHADEECASGTCFSTPRCSGGECIGEGWCSAPCTGSADCGEGTSCVVIPCAEGQTTGCGNLCLHACVSFTDCGVFGGACSALQTPERTLASVCDVRREDGRVCTEGRECLSTRCVDGMCVP